MAKKPKPEKKAQPDLFSVVPPAPPKPEFGTEAFKLHRRNDPDTSADAAYSIDTTALEAMVFTAIKSFGASGCIADDLLDRFNGYAYSSITARFKALADKKLIRCGPEKRKGRSGRGQRIMVAIS